MAQGKKSRAWGSFGRRSAILSYLAPVATLMRSLEIRPILRERPQYEHSNRQS